jgi:hypothetical protein
LEGYEKLKEIDWSFQSMDGALIKALLGGEKKAQTLQTGQKRR